MLGGRPWCVFRGGRRIMVVVKKQSVLNSLALWQKYKTNSQNNHTKVSEFKPMPDTVNAPFCVSSCFPIRNVSTRCPLHGQLVVVAVVAW